MKKRIIFVLEALWVGGIETALTNLLNRLDYEKYDVTCLIVRNYTELAYRVPPQCRLIVADRQQAVSFREPYRYGRLYGLMEEPQTGGKFRRFEWKAAHALLRAPEMRLYADYIKKQLNGEHFDTAVIYSDRTAEIAVRSIRADKYLLYYHNALIEKAYHDEIGYQKSEKIISVSEEKCAALKQFRPKYADKMIAVHNIVNIEEICRKSRESANDMTRDKGFCLVTCGRLCHQKGIDWAITACRELLKRGYGDIQWYIVGGGPDEVMLRQLAKSAEVEEHFHFLGMKENPYPYIAGADLYVQPSRYENYSVVILEAMALCKPILATIPAAREQITSGKNGFLCEDSPEKIAKGIAYLHDRPDVRSGFVRELSENGLEKQNLAILKQLEQLL